jgi:hypothetical protein
MKRRVEVNDKVKVILGHEVASFRVKGKRYKPGDMIELPDNFPVTLYKHLKVVKAGVPSASPLKVVPPTVKKVLDIPFRKK